MFTKESTPSLPSDRRTRVLVVGGGVVGLSLARECLLRGCHVTVLERYRSDAPASGAGSRAALGVLNVPKWGVSAWRRLVAMAYALYPRLADEIRETTGVDIGLRRRGGLHVLDSPQAEDDRGKAVVAFGKGGFDVEWLDEVQLSQKAPWLAPRFRAALWIPGECVVSARQLLAGLRATLVARGAILREGVGAVQLHGTRRAVTLSSGETLEGDVVFLATGSWLASVLPPGSWGTVLIDPVCGQALELRSQLPEGPTIHFVSARDGEGYYFLSHGAGRAWVGSTVEEVGHRWRTTFAGARQLLDAAGEIDPRVRARDARNHWAGLRPRAGRLGGPFLDRLPGREGVWIATGHYRSGILAGPVSAALLVRRVFEPGQLTAMENEVLAGFAIDSLNR